MVIFLRIFYNFFRLCFRALRVSFQEQYKLVNDRILPIRFNGDITAFCDEAENIFFNLNSHDQTDIPYSHFCEYPGLD